MKVSKRATARALGVTLSSLQEAISTGRVTWPPVSADALREEWLASSGEQGPAPLRADTVDAESGDESQETRAEALRRRAVYEADLKGLQLERERAKDELGDALPANAVEFAAERFWVLERTRLRSVLPEVIAAALGRADQPTRLAILAAIEPHVQGPFYRLMDIARERAKHMVSAGASPFPDGGADE